MAPMSEYRRQYSLFDTLTSDTQTLDRVRQRCEYYEEDRPTSYTGHEWMV